MIITNIIADLSMAIVIWFTAIIFHEIGHYTVAQNKGYKPRFILKKLSVVVDEYVPPAHEKKILAGGVVTGGVIILATGWLVLGFFPSLIILYWFGCRSDIKRLQTLKRLEKENIL